jgi:hypothetical protein
MKSRKHSFALGIVMLIITVLIFTLPQIALAADFSIKDLPGNIHIGSVRLHPYFSVQGFYTDNIFLEHTNEKEDWKLVYIPGIIVQVPFHKKRHLFQFDYRAEIIRHKDFSYYDMEKHRASVLFKFKFPWGLDLTVGDEFIKSATWPDFEGDSLDDYFYNDARIEGVYKLGERYKLKMYYENFIKEFWDWTILDSYIRNEGAIDLYYRFLPKTNVLIEYRIFYHDNDDRQYLSTDNLNNHISVGLAWEPGAKLKGEIKGGFVSRVYEEYGRDESTIGLTADLTYYLNNYTSFRLEATREIIATEITDEDVFYGTHFIRMGGALSVKYMFPFLSHGYHQVSAIAEGFYYDDEYRETGIYTNYRHDVQYGGSAEIALELWERLGFKVKYRYIDNTSNFVIENYREHRFFGQISLTL